MEFQQNRTSADCAMATQEIFLSLKGFTGVYGAYGKEFTLEQEKVLSPFIDRTGEEVVFFAKRLKKDYPRPRPYDYISGITPCVRKEKSMAYPSGHAALSRVYAKVLGVIYPELKNKFQERSDEIAKNRVLGGVHHPSDIESGKKLGALIFEDVMKSEKYRKEIERVKSELALLEKNKINQFTNWYSMV